MCGGVCPCRVGDIPLTGAKGERVERSEVKRFLKRYIRLVERRRNIAERIKRIEESATGTTAKINGMPRASGTGDKVGSGASEAADFRRELDAMDAEARKAEREIFAVIDQVEDARRAEVLARHYLEFESFPQIAREMNFTERWVHELHGRGLEDVRRIIESGAESEVEEWEFISRA